MRQWKTLSRKTILDRGKYLTVEEHAIELPDGRVIEHWPWIVTPDFVIVVAITAGGAYVCFRQTKYGVEGTSLAPTGGYIEPGEDPLEAAKRELLEETGYQATEWIDLGAYVVDANRGVATAYLYLARDARPVAAPDADDLEDQQLLLLGRDKVEAALARGEFKALPWAAAVALALLHLKD
ncbi:MAG: NUDIX hydrolase [Anaerolineae bacterium]|nr:NUDIX hydrolase [Anaerolineae bacterium]